jgi:hypothetical protein
MNQTLQTQSIIESPPRDESTGFDLRTEIKDQRTGRIIRSQPYDIVIDRVLGQMFKRGGKYFRLNGTEVKNYGIVDAAEAPAEIQGATVDVAKHSSPKSHRAAQQ